jgi:SAM-dependent methyltransferase
MDHHHDHQPSDLPRALDLDAEVFASNLAAVMNLIEQPDVRTIVDLGAGSGAGSRLLRERFPNAAVTCVDNDPQMLRMLGDQGFATVEANLDHGFPALQADLVWASSSFHHVANPARLLAGIREALGADGLLVVVELAALPLFLGGSELERSCHAAAAAEGWNHHPDWAPVIEAAGFTVTRSEVSSSAEATPAAREYAREWFARFLLLETLSADDRDAVARLLDSPDELALEPRTTRTVWIAR